ncbi:MAG: 4-hydroxythreonine-4-phosphate dehydrogenase PdxA [Planctomycetota bacterium]
MPSTLPTLAITAGDYAGVGPELSLAAAAAPRFQDQCRLLIFGNPRVLARCADQLQLPMPPIVDSNDLRCHSADELPHRGVVDCKIAGNGPPINTPPFDAAALIPGRWTAYTGRESYDNLIAAIDTALANTVDGIVTGPIQKEAWAAAGITFPGHTEVLAQRCAAENGQQSVRMMLAGEHCRVVLVTVHVPLQQVSGMLSQEAILETIDQTDRSLMPILQRRPRIAVLGLNPHAGESGLFGNEEISIIEPAIAAAISGGYDVKGPLPPDTAFTPSARQRFDAHVCMYHDQGLIPLKALSFDDGINVTLGLTIRRSSVDHGTAMDLAWQGTASTASMFAAIQWQIDHPRTMPH